jgi:alginate O-acetyltransferase complex protein AlgI
MLFNSLHFVFFFPIVTAGFFLLPQKWRWAWLLVASCYFYMVFVPLYILILGWTIAIDYCAGLLIARSQGRARKTWLGISIAANVGVLAFFKYYNFINGNVSGIFSLLRTPYPIPNLAILLPIGLSFHTFQAMSYTIEVYRGNQSPERHLGIYALYVMFFPQLVAGPIERPQHLLPQFLERHTLDYDRMGRGLQLMAWGFFKKVVIADRLAMYVREVYDDPRAYVGGPLLMATFFFAFQIYCDFSGYSDIAIGSAQVLGFRLRKNFRGPYLSRQISEFWRRWHISLSTWFRDYVYIPLGGSRTSRSRLYFNLFVTFLLSGLWHGANWTFVVWGALNGLYLIIGHLTRRSRERLFDAIGFGSTNPVRRSIQIVSTFCLVCAGWVFFRAHTLRDAFYIFANAFKASNGSVQLPTFGHTNFALSLLLIAFLIGVEFWGEWIEPVRVRIATLPGAIRWTAYYALLMTIIAFGMFAGRQAFIYFQF